MLSFARSRSITRFAAPAAAALMVLGVAACGGDDNSPAAPPASESSATASAESQAGSAEPIKSSAELGERMQAAVTAKETAKVAVESSTGVGAAEGAIRFTKGDSALAMSVNSSGGEMKLIVVGDALYISLGKEIDGKKWLRIDSKGDDAVSKMFAQAVLAVQSSSDVEAWQRAFAKAKSFEAAGTETIEGEELAKYTLDLDEAGLKAQLPEEWQKGEMSKALKGAKAETVLYLDAEDLPRRIETTATTQGQTTTTTVTYSEWGAPVTIEKPAAGDVADLAELGDLSALLPS